MLRNVPAKPYRTRSVYPPPDRPQLGIARFEQGRPLDHFGPHVHDFFVLVYIQQGGGWHRAGAVRRETQAGDLFLIAPGEVHDSYEEEQAAGWIVFFVADALGDGRLEFDSLVWPENPALLPFARPPGIELSYLSIPPEDRPRWEARLRSLTHELELPRLGYREAAHALLKLILIDAARLVSPLLDNHAAPRRPVVEAVLNYINDHFAEPISLVDVARAVGRTPGYLTTTIRNATGRTVLEWITARRMIEARRLLVETDEDIATIGERVGYADPTYFIRQFRRIHGVTPLSWRRSHR
ncbi:MAG: AraC family transcriptional regulator [Chloroflexota bacterium]|nr:AraC family transcriptional regulator [Dehalococcoidia bacterium]MDW8253011.1 AraC family transcriptional regulator [Chloroflexota bacterium]